MSKSPEELAMLAHVIKGIAQQAILFFSIEDCDQLIERLGVEDALMPIVDPTRWRNERKTLEAGDQMLRAFVTFRKALEKIREGLAQ